MKVNQLIETLLDYAGNSEVRIIDVTREELGDVTYSPSFDFEIEEMNDTGIVSEPFIALSFNPDKQ